MPSESDDSARTRLIETRHGTWIDKTLLPAARRECLEILQAASETVREDVVKMIHRDTRPLEGDSFWRDFYHRAGYRALIRGGLEALQEELLKYRLPEEDEARELAYEAGENAGMCGCCGRKLLAHEPAYFGAEVYVGMEPLW